MMTRVSQLDLDLDMEQRAAVLKSYSEHNPGSPTALVFLTSNKNYRVLGYDAYIVAGILRMDPEFFPYNMNGAEINLPVLDIVEPLVGEALETIGYEIDRPVLLPWDERFEGAEIEEDELCECCANPDLWHA